MVKKKKKKFQLSKNRKKIIFIANTKNQLNSLEPVFKLFKKEKEYSPIYYQDQSFLSSLRKYTDLLKSIFYIKKIWYNYNDYILKDMNYESIKVNGLMKDFYIIHLFRFVVSTFNNLYHFEKFLKDINPSALVLAEELSSEGRLYAEYCRLKNIPTIYVPHAALPVYYDLVTRTDFNCIASPGIIGKKYLIERGEPEENVHITGRARYDYFYKKDFNQLTEINDMFNNQKYKFEPNKFTILFTTNPIGNKAIEKQVTSVINAIKNLNLIDNLVIKLHPRENGLIYKKILTQLNVKPIIVRDYNIFDLILSSKILLSAISTTILEAMIIGTPVILLDFVNLDISYTGTYLFGQEKYVITVKNQKMLSEELQELLNNNNHYTEYRNRLKENAKKFSFFNEKTSNSKIIHDLILKTINDNEKNC